MSDAGGIPARPDPSPPAKGQLERGPAGAPSAPGFRQIEWHLLKTCFQKNKSPLKIPMSCGEQSPGRTVRGAA